MVSRRAQQTAYSAEDPQQQAQSAGGAGSGVGQDCSVQQCASACTTGSQPIRSLWIVSLAHSHISAAAGLGANIPETCDVPRLSHPCGGRTCYGRQQALNVFTLSPFAVCAGLRRCAVAAGRPAAVCAAANPAHHNEHSAGAVGGSYGSNWGPVVGVTGGP